MAENTLSEGNSEKRGMEEQSTSEEPHPTPDAALNENQENYGGILVVKEEDISDVELDTFYEVEVASEQKNNNQVEMNNPEVEENAQIPAGISERIPEQIPAQVIQNIPAQVPAQVPDQMPAEASAPERNATENPAPERTEKKRRHRKRKKPSPKPICNHQNTDSVIVRRRLRCAACMAHICPECHSGVNTTLSNHLATSDNKNQFFYHCRTCRLAFKTNCALQAHNRLHGLGEPYVCPDCGSVFRTFYNFAHHIMNRCCHIYKVMRSGCELCLHHDMSVADYLAHIEQAHLRPIFKCSRCECVNETGKALEQHFLRNHQFERTLCLRYFSCTVCENLVFSEHIYWRHLDYHRDYSTVFKTGYLCSCNQSFNTPSSLRLHLEGCSRKGVIPPQWSFLKMTLQESNMQQARNNNTIRIVQEADDDLTDGDSFSDMDPNPDDNLGDNFEIDDGDFDEDAETRAVLEFLQEEGSSSSTVFSDVSSSQISSGSTSSTVFSDASSNQIRPPYVSRPVFSSGSSVLNSDSSGKEGEDGFEESFNELTFRDLDDSTNGEVDESTSDFVFPKSPEMSSDGQDERGEGELGDKISSGAEGSPPDNERELSSDQDEQMDRESSSIPTIDLDDVASLESPSEVTTESSQDKEKGEEGGEEEKEKEKADGDGEQNQNVVYEHIPCDHLGYVKVQQNVEPRNKNKNKNKKKKKKPAKTPETSDEGAAAAAPDNFEETSVLDEKTGFMKTKRVLIQRSELDKRNRGQFGANPGPSNESLARDVLKTKNSTFFSCPFCSVLFPKHGSSFQKFRLHMECYHPDASLDIDVDRSGAPRSETKFAVVGQTPAKSDNTSDEESGDLDDLNTGARMSFVMDSNGEGGYGKYASLNGFGSPESENKGNDSFGKNENKGNSTGKFDVEMKSVNDENEEGKSMEGNKLRPATGAGKNSDARNLQDSAGVLVNPSLIQKIVQSKNNFSKQNPVKPNAPGRDFKMIASTEQAGCILNPGRYFPEDSGNRNFGTNRNFAVNFARIDENNAAENITLHRNQVSILNHKSKRMQENDPVPVMQKNEPGEGAQKRRRRRRKSSKSSGSEFDNLSLCSRTTLERELFPYSSSESVETPTKEMEKNPQDEENVNDADLNDHSAERRDAKKESDVWSEFYKTLKVAETLKKTNVKDQENPGAEEASILTNYTNKRVVKKPKRYRESSDSEESDEEKQSPNISKSSDKADEDDEIAAKKKDLIKRLENVDYKILDYVVNLLEKNEKSQAAAKKEKDESVKSSKKKMSDGVKVAGKQIAPVAEGISKDVDGEAKNKGKSKKGKRQRRQRKNKKKGEVEDKKETDKDQEKDKEKGEGQDQNQDQDRNQDQGSGQDQDQDKEKDDEQKDNENGKDKDKDKDDDKDKDKGNDKDKKDKKDKKGKGKGKGKDKNKDKDNDKDEDKNITDVDADEANMEPQTGNNPEAGSAEKKKRRRKKTEPLIIKERRRSSYEGEVNPSERKSGSGDGESFSSKKKRRLASKSQYHRRMSVSPESNEFSSGQVISTRASETEKKFTCAICGATASNKADFKDHILIHRVDENTYQCMECGECFVVRPSLEKHLHAYHKIKDVEKYIEENEASTPLRNDDSDSETLKENQCKVCRDEFPTALDLSKHFRIHGMAFLQQVKKEARHH